MLEVHKQIMYYIDREQKASNAASRIQGSRCSCNKVLQKDSDLAAVQTLLGLALSLCQNRIWQNSLGVTLRNIPVDPVSSLLSIIFSICLCIIRVILV